MRKIDKKIKKLRKLTINFPFVEYYSHTECDMYKIFNEYTPFHTEKLVLCSLKEGFETAIDLAIEYFDAEKKKHQTVTSF